MNIYFVRHPETQWNKAGILQGHKDSSLTPDGEDEAKKLGELLKIKNIEIIYSSDLGRCIQTAEIINSFINKEIVKVLELRERNFGDLNGRPNSEVREILNLSDPNQLAPNGESFNQMRMRVLKFVQSLSAKNFKNILLVTHEGVTRAILSDYRVVRQGSIYKIKP